MTCTKYKFSRYGGYECSSKGDKRFSAFNAKMPDGRSIEEHYQCDVKGYDPGGTNWRLGKGKPPLDNTIDAKAAYFELWRTWVLSNKRLLVSLAIQAAANDYTLSDMFATTEINQANALATILNEYATNATT